MYVRACVCYRLTCSSVNFPGPHRPFAPINRPWSISQRRTGMQAQGDRHWVHTRGNGLDNGNQVRRRYKVRTRLVHFIMLRQLTLYMRLNYAFALDKSIAILAQQKLNCGSARGSWDSFATVKSSDRNRDDNLMRFWQRNFRRWWLSLVIVSDCRTTCLKRNPVLYLSPAGVYMTRQRKTSMEARNFASTSVHISELKGSRRVIDLARSAVLRPRFSTLFPRRLLLHHRQCPFICNVDLFSSSFAC